MSIIRIPDGNDLGTKKLKGVGHFKMYWHLQGKYIACTFKSLEQTESMDSGILILEVGEHEASHLSTTSLGKTCSILSFSFEPQGSRFAVIYGRKQDVSICIMDLNNISCDTTLPPLLGLQVNSIHWSPTGGLIVLSGYDNFVLYDVNKMKILVQKHFTQMVVEWSPSGR